MNRTCIVVVDFKRARFFGVEPDGPRAKVRLVERQMLDNPDFEDARRGGESSVKTERITNRQAGDVHPIDARRDQHRLEIERRFGREVSREMGQVVKGWSEGTVVLVAEPKLLGLMREPARKSLHPGIALKELAKDYAQLTASELHDHLALNSIIPARRGPVP